MRRVAFLILAGCLSCCRPPSGEQRASGRTKVIDSHVHITPTEECMERALKIFERAGVDMFCTKSAGHYGSGRFSATAAAAARLGGRMAFFANIDWSGFGTPGWTERELDRLEKAAAAGARGIKIFKNLGLRVRDQDGKLVAADDPRLDPIISKCGELGLIVAIHTADPEAFFQPPTPDNPRYLELLLAPSWSFHGKEFPSRSELLAQRNRLIERHPGTTFLGIHLANDPEHLDEVAGWLDRFPNLYVDISARIPEIGRHPPEQVRSFFIRYQDRILFGTDLVVSPDGLQLGSVSIFPQDDDDAVEFYRAHYRYLETYGHGLEHPTPVQGEWKVDGIALPEEVLTKIYRTNALKLIWNRE
ncbi:MAG: amidohydrolase [Deltaproteobacteria bacterium]|nr:MAG: amidohydrolase [Deltaproteobacteria bacterium]